MGDHHCVISRLHGSALLMIVKQCKLTAPLFRLSRSAEHALSIAAAVHQMTRELDSSDYNNNDDSMMLPIKTMTITT